MPLRAGWRGPKTVLRAILAYPGPVNQGLRRGRLSLRVRRALGALRPYEPERVYLFGSHARREVDRLSDVDLVVIKRTATPFLERLREVARLLPAEAGAVDVLVYTPGELDAMLARGNAFAEMIAEEGRLVDPGEPGPSRGAGARRPRTAPPLKSHRRARRPQG